MASAAPRKRTGRALRILRTVLFHATVFSLIPALIVYKTWSSATALEREWKIEGPPCPEVAQPSAVATRHGRPPMTVSYGGATFTRSFAAVSCGAVPINPFWPSENEYVCRFNNPGAVVVRTADRRLVFEPPVGNPATVTVNRGRVSCVVAGGFGT